MSRFHWLKKDEIWTFCIIFVLKKLKLNMMIKRLFLFLALVSLLSVGTLSAQFSLGIKASYETDLGFDEKWALSDGQMNFIADPSQGFNRSEERRVGKEC